ncbi:MAG: MFS transporter, partial [Verrucomicrobiales bacterium]
IIVATAIGFGVSPLLQKQLGLSTSAIIFAAVALILMPLPFLAAPADSKRRRPEPSSRPQPSLWQGMKVALQHRRFIGLTALFAGSQMSFTVMTAAASFIVVELLGGEKADVTFVLGPLFAFALPCFFAVPTVSRKIGWEKGMMLGSLGLGVIYCISGFLGANIIHSPIITAAILFSLGGPMVALLFGLEGEGVVACARERGGDDTVSIYWGVFNFIVKGLNGVALFITGWLTTLSNEHGSIAIRAMSFVAGSMLLLGVVLYFVIKRGGTPPPAIQEG